MYIHRRAKQSAFKIPRIRLHQASPRGCQSDNVYQTLRSLGALKSVGRSEPDLMGAKWNSTRHCMNLAMDSCSAVSRENSPSSRPKMKSSFCSENRVVLPG